ncbi:MAG: hypothetical protein MHM6MM_002577 [Cercozoa sp. M6MM]
MSESKSVFGSAQWASSTTSGADQKQSSGDVGTGKNKPRFLAGHQWDDRRGRGRSRRGGRGRRGRGGKFGAARRQRRNRDQKPFGKKSAEQLDKDLDRYMSATKDNMDAELDAYLSRRDAPAADEPAQQTESTDKPSETPAAEEAKE